MVSWQGIPSHALILQSICTVQQFFGLKAGVKNSVSAWTPHSLSFMGSLCVNIERPNTLWLAAFNSKKMPSTWDLILLADKVTYMIWDMICKKPAFGVSTLPGYAMKHFKVRKVSSAVLFCLGRECLESTEGAPFSVGEASSWRGTCRLGYPGPHGVESPRALSLPASKLNLTRTSARDESAKGWPEDAAAQVVPTLSFLVWKCARQPYKLRVLFSPVEPV